MCLLLLLFSKLVIILVLLSIYNTTKREKQTFSNVIGSATVEFISLTTIIFQCPKLKIFFLNHHVEDSG
jgi:hypothetical protein